MSGGVKQKTILILASSPLNQGRLRLDEEVREIDLGLRVSKYRDYFRLEQRWAVRPNDLQQAMLDFKPSIVHFCGHGVSHRANISTTAAHRDIKSCNTIPNPLLESGGLALEDSNGKMHIAPTQALADLFGIFSDDLECVVLNACYTEEQADAIAHYVPYVIGMRSSVQDRAAIKFAIGFYRALGAGRSFETAHRMGCNEIALWNLPDHLTPALKRGAKSKHIISTPVEPDLSPLDYSILHQINRDQAEDLATKLKSYLAENLRDSRACCALGLLYLHTAFYSESVRNLRKAIDQNPGEADLHYYYALALIAGRRPRTIPIMEARTIEQRLETALQLDKTQAKFYYLLGLFKQDRYSSQGKLYTKPSPEELFRLAQNKSYDVWEGERLLSAVKITDRRLLDIIRRV